MMFKTKIALALMLAYFLPTHASPHCMAYTEKDFETGVGHDGPLRLIPCDCECAKFDHTDGKTCTNCLHHQASAPERVLIQLSDDPETPPIVLPVK